MNKKNGEGVAEYVCNKCGGIYERDMGWRTWLKSYCEKTGQEARLYRISVPGTKGVK